MLLVDAEQVLAILMAMQNTDIKLCATTAGSLMTMDDLRLLDNVTRKLNVELHIVKQNKQRLEDAQ